MLLITKTLVTLRSLRLGAKVGALGKSHSSWTGANREKSMHKPNQPTPNPELSDEPEDTAPGSGRFDADDHVGARYPGSSRAEFPNLEPDTNSDYKQDVDLDLVLDIPVSMTMEVGATRLSIRNLLQLGRGSVVELDRLAGEPMDVKVNGVLVAQGEVVVVNEKFGIRLTNVIRPTEWIRKLK